MANSDTPHIVVRGVNWLGDAVMSTPALQRLREAHPRARITLVTPEKLAALYLHHPSLDDLLPFAPTESLWHLARRIRARRFDWGLVLPNSPRSALELFLGGVPRRVGYARGWRRLFLTQPVPDRPGAVAMHKRSPREIRDLVATATAAPRAPQYPPESHHLHQYLHLAAACGANPAPLPPLLAVSAAERSQLLARLALPPGPVLGLNAGAEYGPAKRWPADRFVQAARHLQSVAGVHCLVFGGKNDQTLAQSITAQLAPEKSGGRVINLAGQTTLRELMAALELCGVLITNDTGPMHVAAALGTPVVVPFGSTSPELTGPGLPGTGRQSLLKSQVPCSPCFLRECPIDFRCMQSLAVDPVVEAALGWLQRSGPGKNKPL